MSSSIQIPLESTKKLPYAYNYVYYEKPYIIKKYTSKTFQGHLFSRILLKTATKIILLIIIAPYVMTHS